MIALRLVALTVFTVGMMFALHPLPREPWGVLGLGDLFTGYVAALVGGSMYAAAVLHRPRSTTRATIVAYRHATAPRRKAA